MRFFKLLDRLPLYVRYFLTVVDEHSLQAPFIYDFYTTIRQRVQTSGKEYSDIEAIRWRLRHSHETVEGIDFGAGSLLGKSSKNKISGIARSGISSSKECLVKTQLLALTEKRSCLELGTSLGISTAYLARSMPNGHVVTIEGNEGLCRIAQSVWEELNLPEIVLYQSEISKVLLEIIQKYSPFDFVVMDANHRSEAILRYFNLLLRALNREAIVYVDDIRWSVDMYRAWKAVSADSRISVSIETLKFGLLIFKPGIRGQHYVLRF